MNPNDKRQSIIDKVRALAQKTVENGATEAEANSAAEKVRDLMREYSLSMEDLDEVANDAYGVGRRPGPNWYRGDKYRDKYGRKTVSWHHASKSYGAIARLCNVKWWMDNTTRELVFFGAQVDVEMAFFLAAVVKSALDSEWRSYMIRYGTNKGKAGFMLAMAYRLGERMLEIAATRDLAKATDKTNYGLVLVKKDAVVDSRYAKFLRDSGMKVKTSKTSRPTLRYDNAIAAGRAAADKVSLHHQMSGGQFVRPKQLAS